MPIQSTSPDLTLSLEVSIRHKQNLTKFYRKSNSSNNCMRKGKNQSILTVSFSMCHSLESIRSSSETFCILSQFLGFWFTLYIFFLKCISSHLKYTSVRWNSNTCLIGLGSSSISMGFSGLTVFASPFFVFGSKPLSLQYNIFEEWSAFEKLRWVVQRGCLKIGWQDKLNVMLFLMPLLSCSL